MTNLSRRLTSPPMIVAATVAVVVLCWTHGCRLPPRPKPRLQASAGGDDASLVTVTGYCDCGTCCGWTRSWFGFGPPVYASGPLKGRRKQVGITATGTRTHHGTVAADPALYPMGTRLRIPGYGEGTVEDVGGAIKGRHIDLWFPSHEEAVAWGVQRIKVETVSRPPAKRKKGK